MLEAVRAVFRRPDEPEQPHREIKTWEDIGMYKGREITLKAPIEISTSGMGARFNPGVKVRILAFDYEFGTVDLAVNGVQFKIQTQLIQWPIQIEN